MEEIVYDHNAENLKFVMRNKIFKNATTDTFDMLDYCIKDTIKYNYRLIRKIEEK